MSFTIGEIKEKNKSGIKELKINLEIDLIVKNTKKVKEQLLEVMNRADTIHISSKESCAIDLSGIQLLISLLSHTQILGKKVFVNLSFSPETNTILEHVGISAILNQFKN